LQHFFSEEETSEKERKTMTQRENFYQFPPKRDDATHQRRR
jgi:hypothetical protein